MRRAIIRCNAGHIREHIAAIYDYSNHGYNIRNSKFSVDYMGRSSLSDLAKYLVEFGGVPGQAAAVRLPDNQVDGRSYFRKVQRTHESIVLGWKMRVCSV